jgi:uncharacterized protein (TIGR04255 family)
MSSAGLPKKLKHDCIVEALCELQFQTEEQAEIVIGRLSDRGSWREWSKFRLPVSDIPPIVRATDPQLQFQPILEFRGPEGDCLIKIGSNVISIHNIGRYWGWEIFQPKIMEVVDSLFECIRDTHVSRVGFRYVNAATNLHLIARVSDLALAVRVDDKNVGEPINLNYAESNDRTHVTMTRIASPVFVQGRLPEGTTAVIDIDVTSPPGFISKSKDEVITWTSEAHDYEKSAFFRLIPKDILEKLVEN